MFCPTCGRELPKGSRFCPGCGEALRDVASGPVPPVPRRSRWPLVLGAVAVAAVAIASVVALLSTGVLGRGGAKLPNGRYELYGFIPYAFVVGEGDGGQAIAFVYPNDVNDTVMFSGRLVEDGTARSLSSLVPPEAAEAGTRVLDEAQSIDEVYSGVYRDYPYYYSSDYGFDTAYTLRNVPNGDPMMHVYYAEDPNGNLAGIVSIALEE